MLSRPQHSTWSCVGVDMGRDEVQLAGMVLASQHQKQHVWWEGVAASYRAFRETAIRAFIDAAVDARALDRFADDGGRTFE